MLNINQIKPAAQFLRLQTVENLLPLKDHNLMYFIYCNDTILGTFFEIAWFQKKSAFVVKNVILFKEMCCKSRF